MRHEYEKPETCVYIIEGLDRLGKGTLINGIIDRQGYFPVIHMSKPVKTAHHSRKSTYYNSGKPLDRQKTPAEMYQRESFEYMLEQMRLTADNKHRVIFDRGHLGENVYAPIYRGYSGEYVFDFEYTVLSNLSFEAAARIKLILLTEDFSKSKHFTSDGESFDDSKRQEEQNLFLAAFNKSVIPNKKIICVTDTNTGGFRDPADILKEALQ